MILVAQENTDWWRIMGSWEREKEGADVIRQVRGCGSELQH